jgi:hypothetical protein
VGRARRRGLASAAGAAALLATAGCGIEPTGVQVVGAPPAAQAAGALPGGGPSSGQYPYYLYFFRAGHLSSTTRFAAAPVDQRTVIEALINGPRPDEAKQGFVSEIPSSLKILDLTAQGEAWAYQFSDELGRDERAQIVCSIQANLPAPSVATVYGGARLTWNICWEDFPDLGAPAYLPNAADVSASPTGEQASPGT